MPFWLCVVIMKWNIYLLSASLNEIHWFSIKEQHPIPSYCDGNLPLSCKKYGEDVNSRIICSLKQLLTLHEIFTHLRGYSENISQEKLILGGNRTFNYEQFEPINTFSAYIALFNLKSNGFWWIFKIDQTCSQSNQSWLVNPPKPNWKQFWTI